jgi:hypothetical protein
MRDTPSTNDDGRVLLFDTADLVRARRMLAHPHVRWTIGMAMSAEPADRATQRQCVEALAEGIHKQSGDEAARAVRLAMLLVAAGMEPAQPTDEQC